MNKQMFRRWLNRAPGVDWHCTACGGLVDIDLTVITEHITYPQINDVPKCRLCGKTHFPPAKMNGIQARSRATGLAIEPDLRDHEEVARMYGPLPLDASYEQKLRHYKLAQTETFCRLYENGKLPLPLMRLFDRVTSGS